MPRKSGKKVISSGQERGKRAERLSKRSHFNKEEVERLLMMLKAKSTKVQTRIDRNVFRDILHDSFGMVEDMLIDRIFRVLDRDNDGHLNEEEWVYGLSVLLKGTKEEQINFCFSVYDLNSDGFVSREEMFHFLKSCLIQQQTDEDPDEGIKDLIEVALKKMDHDHDGRLSLEDFKKSVELDPLVMEILGECLPAKKPREAFLELISGEHGKPAPEEQHHDWEKCASSPKK